MKKVKIKVIGRVELGELILKVKNQLTNSKNTKIFISNNLFKRLIQDNESCIIWEEALLDSFCDNSIIEKAFIFGLKENSEIKICQMHFVQKATNYMQLTFFASKHIIYRSYLSKNNEILIFYSDQN